jgi:hypothetical protein
MKPEGQTHAHGSMKVIIVIFLDRQLAGASVCVEKKSRRGAGRGLI